MAFSIGWADGALQHSGLSVNGKPQFLILMVLLVLISTAQTGLSHGRPTSRKSPEQKTPETGKNTVEATAVTINLYILCVNQNTNAITPHRRSLISSL